MMGDKGDKGERGPPGDKGMKGEPNMFRDKGNKGYTHILVQRGMLSSLAFLQCFLCYYRYAWTPRSNGTKGNSWTKWDSR